MHISTSAKRKTFAVAVIALAAAASGAAALALGLTPLSASHLARMPDTQIAVFMVPLTILVLAILAEAVRDVVHGSLPAEAPLRPARRLSWSPGRGEG